MASVPWLDTNPIRLMDQNKGVFGINVGHMWDESDRLAGWLAQLLELWTRGQLRTQVHAAVPFSDAPEAHRILHDRENLGKVVLVP
jgi:NADPH:quinone reductase-like Zn-dependent oxidoreductase